FQSCVSVEIKLYKSKGQISVGTFTQDVPNWAMTSSDFFGWIEELRNHAGYDKIEELARTFWAHFPSASRLGYDPPAPEE
uniref:Si:ch73-23l24.1 n=1 Tax=Astyanax mexicanus TaxID=7994 RepID=A0A8B9L6I5_ASTMX